MTPKPTHDEAVAAVDTLIAAGAETELKMDRTGKAFMVITIDATILLYKPVGE